MYKSLDCISGSTKLSVLVLPASPRTYSHHPTVGRLRTMSTAHIGSVVTMHRLAVSPLDYHSGNHYRSSHQWTRLLSLKSWLINLGILSCRICAVAGNIVSTPRYHGILVKPKDLWTPRRTTASHPCLE